MDVGCGNGYLLEAIREQIPFVALVGSDYSPEMVTLARTRGITDCSIDRGDVRLFDHATASFDVVGSERCVVNVIDADEQLHALGKIARRIGSFLPIWSDTKRSERSIAVEPKKKDRPMWAALHAM